MTTTYNKILDLIKDGNKYLLYFLLIFLFIQFAIVIPVKHPVENYALDEANKSIANQLITLDNSIAVLEQNRDSLAKANNSHLASQDTKLLTKKENGLSDNRKTIHSIEQEIFSLQDKRISYQNEFISISNQKKEKRSFSIPVLNVSIDEVIILSTYPGFILIGLCLALLYRRKLIDLLIELTDEEKKNIPFPIWSAPIPLSMKFKSFRSWAFINTMGLASHGIIIYIVIDFFLFRIDKFENEILTVNIFIALAATSVYIITLTHLIKTEWKRIEK
jgi:hypothetical protein